MTSARTVSAREAGSNVDTTAEAQRGAVIAGVLLTLVGIGLLMSIISGEAVYPRNYSTFGNTISDLGGTEPPHSVVVEPTRTLFVVTMLLAGIGILAATWLLHRARGGRRLVIAMTVFGLGLLGIAIFPGDVAGWHPLFAMACFLGGSIAAITSRRAVAGPFRHVAVALGSVALVATVFALEPLEHWGPQDAFGRGGIERWIAYPVLMWLVGFGAVLMSVGVRTTPESVNHNSKEA